MRVLVITPPDPVVTLDDAKAHLKVDGDDEDALIAGYVAAATNHIDGPEGWLGRALGVQTLEARCDGASRRSCIRLPFQPVLDLVSVTYLDADGAEQPADLGGFQLFGSDLASATSSWAWAGGSGGRESVRIRYRAGYETIPPAIRAAILLMTADLYRNRGESVIGASTAMAAMTPAVANLLAPYRVYT